MTLPEPPCIGMTVEGLVEPADRINQVWVLIPPLLRPTIIGYADISVRLTDKRRLRISVHCVRLFTVMAR